MSTKKLINIADSAVCSDRDEAFVNALAGRLYHAYGSARNWTRSEGKPMDRVLMHAPEECRRAWRSVAEEAIKYVV